MDVIRQKKRHKALSVSAAPSQLSQRESQGCFFDLFLPLRPLFLQRTTPYRASSTAYGGPPSPKGKVLAFYAKLTIQFFFLKTARDTASLNSSSLVSRA